MKTLDLFAGAGGLTEGVSLAGGTTFAAIELDPMAATSLSVNHPGLHVHQGDIRSKPAQRFLAGLRGKVEAVVGGPPCQPFSVAGHQRAERDPRDCIPDFAMAVERLVPRAFVMENVSGLALRRHRGYLRAVLSTLSGLGYRVSAMVLDAADFGVAQHRRRLFIVGIKGRQALRFPRPTHGPGTGRPFAAARSAIAAAAADPPNRAIVTYARNPVLRPSPWDGMLVNGGGRPINLAEPCQTIPASAGGNRTHIVDESGVLEEYHAYLLEGGVPRSGVVPTVRRLTVTESAMIQGFRRDYKFIGKQSARYRQVGNAVPPALAAAVVKSVIDQLAGTEDSDRLRSVDENLLLV